MSAHTPPLPTLLVLASTYPRWAGDVEPAFVHELARRLTRRFRVIVLAPHAQGAKRRELLDGVEVQRYRYAPERLETLVNDGGIVTNLRRASWKYLLVPGFVLMQAWQAWRLVRRCRVDVIHAHWLIPQGVVAALLRSLPGKRVPFLVTSHGADLYALKGRLMESIKLFVADRASTVAVVSGAMRRRLVGMGVRMDKAAVMPMGVDLESRFVPDLSVARSGREILFVGRLVEKKGLRFLLDAMPRVLVRVPEASLSIVGFGPEEAALKEQARALGVNARVRFIGPVSQQQLPDLYRRAALLVAPFVTAASGDEEGLGLVLVEAAGCGCPVLAGDVPAVRDVLGHGALNVVDARDVDQLAAAIIGILHDPRSATIGAATLREGLLGKFGWNHVANAYAASLARCSERRCR